MSDPNFHKTYVYEEDQHAKLCQKPKTYQMLQLEYPQTS